MDLTDYRTLGRSGLAVSPLTLGTMTFGTPRWGTDETESRDVFDAYLAAGGNVVDTAEAYGASEELVGAMVADAGVREELVIATKFGWPRAGGPRPTGGNSARTVRAALDGSLRRLRTDYVDLYWCHVWDRTTPAEEMLSTLAGAVAAGKILYYGFSNTPSWYVVQVATLARAHGLPAPIGLQYGYSLIDRGVELDVLPAGRAMGLGLVPWGPLSAGFLTGKYGRDKLADADRPTTLPGSREPVAERGNRLDGDNPMGGSLFTERNFDVVDVVREVAAELGRPMAQVALAWVTRRPGVSTTLTGASRVEQLTQNIAALDVAFSAEQQARLDAAGALPTLTPYFLADLPMGTVHGATVAPWTG